MDQTITIEEPVISIYVFSALAFAFFMVWESMYPRRTLDANLAWRWGNNFGLGALSWYISAVAGTWMLIWLAQYENITQIGLNSPLRPYPLLGFFILLTVTQFFGYWFHRAFHRWSWLWPLHAIHHADTNVDISTSYRHHPLEPLVSLPFIAPVVIILGVSADSAAAYRLFAVAATLLSHSNVRVPEALEKPLRWLILTPDFHRLHHCSERQYTDSNYGSLLPWFDYLFGTARHRPYNEQETMALGLEYLRDPHDCRLDQQLLMPLRVSKLSQPVSTEAGTNNES